MKTLLLISIIIFTNIAQTHFKYNPYSNSYESTTPNSKLKYNPYSGKYSFQEPSAKLKYNPYSGKYYYSK